MLVVHGGTTRTGHGSGQRAGKKKFASSQEQRQVCRLRRRKVPYIVAAHHFSDCRNTQQCRGSRSSATSELSGATRPRALDT